MRDAHRSATHTTGGCRRRWRESGRRLSGTYVVAATALVAAACAMPAEPGARPDLRDITGADDRYGTGEPVRSASNGDAGAAPRQPGASTGAGGMHDDEVADGEVADRNAGDDADEAGGGAALAVRATPTDDHDQLDSVVNDLLRLRGTVLHDLLRRGPGARLSEDDARRLRAALAGQRLLETTRAFQRYPHDDALRAGLQPVSDLGHAVWTSEQVVHAEPGCVVLIGSYDLSAVAVQPYDADERAVITLARMSDPQLADLGELNPSGWRIEEVVRLVTLDAGEPIPRSQWEDLDYVGSMALASCHDFEAFA